MEFKNPYTRLDALIPECVDKFELERIQNETGIVFLVPKVPTHKVHLTNFTGYLTLEE